MDDSPDLLADDADRKGQRSVSVDLTDNSLLVDISDALSEKDKVKFTVHTKTTMKEFKGNEFSVVRQHEEFVWLHDSYVDDERYAGLLIPPSPMRPDFEASREKLAKLSEGEGSMTKEEFSRMKQELEAEYLAIFKKTVAMHEIFLCRLASHPTLKNSHNFRVFLEYDKEVGIFKLFLLHQAIFNTMLFGVLNVRGKNKKEKITGFFRNITKTADETLLLRAKNDEFFEHEKSFMSEYHTRIKDATTKIDKVTQNHKSKSPYTSTSCIISIHLYFKKLIIYKKQFSIIIKFLHLTFQPVRLLKKVNNHLFIMTECANDYSQIAMALQSLATVENSIAMSHRKGLDRYSELQCIVYDISTARFCNLLNVLFYWKLEARAASDMDLKLADLLRYYFRDTQACKDLLYRRARTLANYENANKELDKARSRGKNVPQAESQQKTAREKFEVLSEVGKQELTEFKGRRVTAFRKNLIELGELQLKHSKVTYDAFLPVLLFLASVW
uniref:PX domain-containing protein n=1 Tax=Ciona savignyi TaxID=51511 RepID=H2Z2G2_CIOSA